YKPKGNNITDERGSPDQNEFLNVRKCYSLAEPALMFCRFRNTTLSLRNQISSFITSSHHVLTTILDKLSVSLQISPVENLASLHQFDGNSGDHLRFVKYSPELSTPPRDPHVMLVPHTDFGTLTLLYSKQSGLEIQNPQTGIWEFVDPRHQPLVIVGDALVKFTNGRLRSCIHRVSLPQIEVLKGEQKYSLGYFLRPEDAVLLRPLTSPLIPPTSPTNIAIRSDEWVKHRVKASMITTYSETQDWEQMKGTAVGWK
ncbi:hypothetical protein F5883DRAFT_406741, partial [Diaporthe sp. PMI_573]